MGVKSSHRVLTSLSHPPPAGTALMQWSRSPASLDKPGKSPALLSCMTVTAVPQCLSRADAWPEMSMSQEQRFQLSLVPAVGIPQHQAGQEHSSTKGVEGILLECQESTSTGRDSARLSQCPRALLHCVGSAGREIGNEVSSSSWKTCARTWALVLHKILLDWQLLSSSAAASAALWSHRPQEVFLWGGGLDLPEGHHDKGSKYRACLAFHSRVSMPGR